MKLLDESIPLFCESSHPRRLACRRSAESSRGALS